jgi:hypothetical protein
LLPTFIGSNGHLILITNYCTSIYEKRGCVNPHLSKNQNLKPRPVVNTGE